MLGIKFFEIGALHIEFYTFFNVLGFFALLAYNLTQKKEKLLNMSFISGRILESRSNSQGFIWLIFFLETFALSAVQFFPGVAFNKLFGILTTDGADNYFGFAYFGAIPLFLFCLIFRIRPLKQIDLYTPGYPASLILFKLACAFGGCCYGKEAEHGLLSMDRARVEVPIQFIEMGVAILILVLLIVVRKKIKTGGMFPLYLTLYSATRFVTEFWRDDFPAIAGRLTEYHFMCLIGVVIGVVLFVLMWFKGDKLDDFLSRPIKKKETLPENS